MNPINTAPVATEQAQAVAQGYNRAREMADEVMAELEATAHGWDEADTDRISGSLLPRVYDCLNLLAIAASPEAAPAAMAVKLKKTDAEAYIELAEAMGYPGGDACGLSPEEWGGALLRDAKRSWAATPAAPSVGTASMYAQQHGLAVTTEWMIGWNACLDAIDAAALAQPAPVQQASIDVPDGYKLVLVPDERAPDEPDWDECKRQAEGSTGLKVEQHTFSILKREVRRWIAHKAAPVQQDAPAPSMVGDAFANLTDGERNILAVALLRFEEGPGHELDKQRAKSMRAAISGQKPAEGET